MLDADISGFFDAMDHEWLIRFIEHQIQDKGVVRHIKKWLKEGILEEGKYRRSEQGSPQGGASRHCSAMSTFTTCLAKGRAWRKKHSRGEVIILRYADAVVRGFQVSQ